MIQKKINRFFSLKKLPSLFGPESFITKIKEEYYFKKKSREIPESRQLAPEPEKIVDEMCRYFDVSIEEINKTKRGWFNKPRNIAIYLIRLLCAKKLTTIAGLFQLNTYGAVSSVIQRVGPLRKNNKETRNDISNIANKINKARIET